MQQIIKAPRARPVGIPPFKVPYETEFLEKSLPEALDLSLQIPASTSLREARRLNYMFYLSINKKLDIQCETEKIQALRPHIQFEEYVTDCCCQLTTLEDFLDLDLCIPDGMIAGPPAEEVRRMVTPLYHKLLLSIKKAKVAEESLKKKEMQKRDIIKEKAAKLEPREVIAGAVRQVLSQNLKMPGGNEEYQIDCVRKFADMLEDPKAIHHENEAHISRRRRTKAELDLHKKNKHVQKNWESQRLDSGHSKTSQEAKGKGKGKESTKGKGKNKGKEGKGKDPSPKGKAKGKGKEGHGSPYGKSNKGKGKSKTVPAIW